MSSEMMIRRATPDDAAAIAHVHVLTARSQYVGIMPADFLASLSIEERTKQWRARLEDPAWIATGGAAFVTADVSGAVVGFTSCGPSGESDWPQFAGEIYLLYVLPAAQGFGAGKRLVSAAASHLANSGMASMLLSTLAANPSRRFYEKLGGRLLGSKMIAGWGSTLEHVYYGWEDITALSAP